MPNKYTSVNPGASLPMVVNQINQNLAKLDAEVTTKQFKDKNGNTMVIGNLQNNQFGMSLFDKNGNGLSISLYKADRFGIVQYRANVPEALDGMAPDDGRPGKWVVKPGKNVLTELGG